MLQIQGLSLPPGADAAQLRKAAARALGLPPSSVAHLTVLRRSIDARKDPRILYTVAVSVPRQGAVLRRCRDGRVSAYQRPPDYVPPVCAPAWPPPVVAGAGPAGLFAALVLALAGRPPILIERGRRVEQRTGDVERFWADGVLDTQSNVQFGEGGAGTFSDGKLTTGTRDPRHRFILQQFVQWGAPPEILYDAKPHIGTDRLRTVLVKLRRRLEELGVQLMYETCLSDLAYDAGGLQSVTVETAAGRKTLPCRCLILCPGHSARDTFEMLLRRGVAMEPKAFALGVRIEHHQAMCDAQQYRAYAAHPGLPASSYKLSCRTDCGRGVFSFCVCPGGQVVAAASEPGGVVSNGMSHFARNGTNINGGLLVGLTPADFDVPGPLGGVALQRQLERRAYQLGGGDFRAPAQRVEDFLLRRPSCGPGSIVPTYRPGVTWGNLWDCLPDFAAQAIAQALPILGRRLRGYDHPDAVLTAVETRSSSPVRILRGSDAMSPTVPGLYPCGEGAGWAGGILSAAADGMRCAEAACRRDA